MRWVIASHFTDEETEDRQLKEMGHRTRIWPVIGEPVLLTPLATKET